jgi:quercetin dioxygenase-like cupin family protein
MEHVMPTRATHYKWADQPVDKPMNLLERKRIIGEQMMISHVTLRKGFSVPSHSHMNEQFACIVSGKLKFTLGDPGSPERNEIVVGAGEVLHLPSMLPHAAEAVEDTVVLDLFSPPSERTGIDQRH